jgi:hypothetical protein
MFLSIPSEADFSICESFQQTGPILRWKRQKLLAGTWQMEEKSQIQNDKICWLFFLLIILLTLPINRKTIQPAKRTHCSSEPLFTHSVFRKQATSQKVPGQQKLINSME